MTDNTRAFGVTDAGFVLKGIDQVLADALAEARAVFGPTADLTSTSALRKLVEVTALEDAELWKGLEDAHYARFVSTASGDALDLLGDDTGIIRRESFATGRVTLTLSGGVPGRRYVLADGLVVVGPSPLAFTLDEVVTLTGAAPVATVGVTCTSRGSQGNLAAGAITAIDPAWAAVIAPDLGTATVAVANAEPLEGGGAAEPDDSYRGRQLGISRTMWTQEAVRQAVLDVDGVVDTIISDPLGGVDVSQSYFDLFDFGTRLFAAERRIGEPYRYDVVVAHEHRWPWQTTGAVPGVLERVSAAVDRLRPPGIHPNIVEADHIEIGVRARVVVEPGYDAAALLTRIKDRVAAGVGALRLGSDVLASQIMRAFTDEPGVVDVQAVHLRRGPAAFGRVILGSVPFQSAIIEAAVGENLAMGPTEMAVFRADSDLHDLQVGHP